MTTTILTTEINGTQPATVSLSIEKEGYAVVTVYTGNPETTYPKIKEIYGSTESEVITKGIKAHGLLVKKYTLESYNL